MPETNAPLPMTVEEITPGWLTSALGVEVRSFETGDTINSTTTVLSLDLTFGGPRHSGIPQKVILKGGFEPHSRGLAAIHECEVRGYAQVFPELGLPAPACYFAEYREDQRQGIVILEDLTVRGVDFCDALRPQTYEQVAGRLTHLARFHARTWRSAELDSGRWNWAPRDMISSYFDFMKPDIWHGLVNAPCGAACSTSFHDMEWARDALERVIRLQHRLPHALIHGDAHLGNTYLEADGSHGFYDPLIHRDHFIRDVGYHIVGALDVADRRRWEEPLLRHYLSELAAHGAQAPSFEETMRVYAAYHALGYLIWLCNSNIYQLPAINTANASRFSAAMLDHDTKRVLQTIE
ncbi:MAG TPA: hypothetical protein VJM34_02700 [Novosphingobium sp.]|nr:hypothetical protein [Novosphingobium sp.]